MRKHAVLISNDKFVAISDERKLKPYTLKEPVYSLGDIWRLSGLSGIDQFWLMPNVDVRFSDEGAYKCTIHYMNEQAKEGPYFALYKRDGVEVAIGCTEESRRKFSWEVKKPLDVLATVDYLQQVGIETIEWSDVSIGRSVFKEKYNRNERMKEQIRECSFDLFELPYNVSACDVEWVHPQINQLVKRGLYFHHVDRSSSYPTSAKSTACGIGDPFHVDGDVEHPTQAGIYHVEWRGNDASLFNGLDLPMLIENEQEWITYDMYEQVRDNGYDVRILEAWMYEKSTTLLRVFCDKMTDYRQLLATDKNKFPYEVARNNAIETMKKAANGFIGSLGSDKFGSLRRPDWRIGVIGKARVTVLNALKRLKKYNPVLVFKDDIWFLSEIEDVNIAMPDLFVRPGPGSFRHKGTVQVTSDVIRECNPNTSPLMLHTFLKGVHKNVGI